MIIYKFDGTLNGIFSCIFNSFTSHEIPDVITNDNIQTGFVDEIKIIESCVDKAKRVIRAFVKYAGEGALLDVKYAYRSGEKNKDKVIFSFIRKTLERRMNISTDFCCPEVLDFYDTIKRIGTEIHRIKGFLRFSLADNGVYYAHFSPDNDITELLISHFSARFGTQPFAIHDVKRNVLAMCYKGERKIIKLDKPLRVYLNSEEDAFINLWQTYYRKVTIKERINERNMLNYMPSRYHEYLSEKRQKIKIV